ncbi:hypothetical protein OBBRIDRAFT_769484 [Obba rivulosa]|uniref:UBA domain-containing protein n=1 Tax=Obba rivulosa TaxID=1052685 RepID=A0A8E2DRR7_9APHY|nr:hypothetical protein OBBRIDRAFT_769484 [Obba rivulosa]
MADSFADLWNSTAPTKQPEPPRKLGALTPNASTSQPPRNDVFSMLAAAGSSSNVASRSISPAGPARPTVNAPAPAKSSQLPVSPGGDAFSSLLPGTLVASSRADWANLTIAERAARTEQERKQQSQQPNAATRQQSSAWDGLDALGGFAGVVQTGSPSAATANHAEDIAWNFGALQPIQASHSPQSSSPAPPVEDDWGLVDFAKPPQETKASAPPSRSVSLFDLDDFAVAPAAPATESPHIQVTRSSTPGDFDFGDREDGLLANTSDDDDILGELGRPISQTRPAPSNHDRTMPSPQPQISGQQSRAVSPPPHIIGQIVEMGFSPQQARVALAATETGLDVQTALEYLLTNGAGAGGTPSGADTPPQGERRPQNSDEGWEPGWERYYEPDEEPAPALRRRPASADGESSGRPSSQRHGGPSSAVDAQRLQEHADKLLAQASEIGLSVFNRANAFWKEGKEKVQKVYEERAAASRGGAGAQKGTQNGRPRWMEDIPDRSDARPEERTGQPLADDEDVLPPHPSGEVQHRGKAPQVPEQRAPSQESRAKTGNLFSDDPPAVYVSPFRRKVPSRGPANSQPSPSLKAPSPRPSSPIQLIQRKTVSAPPSALTASAKHKEAGTEMFKLGRYAEAETLYSSAIAALPEAHLLLVPLYNNRALARIRTGDFSGAIEDCTTVITLIGLSYHPAREAKVTKVDEGASVDLGDGLVKALRRRAEAYEGKEKWDAARQDWETIAAADWAGKVRGDAVRGVGRCRRMLVADKDTGATPQASQPPRTTAPPTRSKPVTPLRGPSPPSAALNKVREANEAAEAEDLAKHELKDAVEAKLSAWKNGKETNIRALIASLDTVLWPELGWPKVGMHELVTPSQVKIRYTKAIAKVHPDKLNVNNTTLKQRMIANGVFGSLNEAWNAFKQ